MTERHLREWHDPTANLAIRLADRDRHVRQRPISPQDIVKGVTGAANYRARKDPSGESYALLEQIQKGGGIK